MVLLDPVLEVEPEAIKNFSKALVGEVTHPATVEHYLEKNPKWSKEDAAIKVAGVYLCSPEAVQAVCDVSLRRWVGEVDIRTTDALCTYRPTSPSV